MDEVRFHVQVGEDGIIRPPGTVTLPRGQVEVTVRSAPTATEADPDPLATTRAWMLEMVEEVEAAGPPRPQDLAEHHDHYAHGKPRS